MLKMFTKKKKNNKGFGLIEVLVSVAIMSIVTLPLAQSFVTSTQVNKKSEVKLSAITVAENKMEQAKALDLELIEKADDGKYYINDDAVDENGNTFNVQTIIDPTKYAELNNGIYDFSTLDVTVKAEITLPESVYGVINKNEYYDIEITIKQEENDGQITEEVFVNFYIMHGSNEIEKILNTQPIYQHTGTETGLEYMVINYWESKDVTLGEVRVYNMDNVPVVIAFNKTAEYIHDSGMDSVVYNETEIPYSSEEGALQNPVTKIVEITEGWDNLSVHLNLDSANHADLAKLAFVDYNFQSYKVEGTEVLHAVDVKVYDYVDSTDESVKYDPNLLLTSLSGSKVCQ